MIEPSRFLEATMHSVTTKKAALAALLVLAALLSIFAVGKRASDPAYHQASIGALAETQEDEGCAPCAGAALDNKTL